MAITIVKPNKKIDLGAVEQFEAAVGEKLPDDYREFLLTFNGGKPEDNEFAIPHGKNEAGVNRFYGLLDERQSGDLLHELEVMVSRIPEKMLLIGDDSSGNYICLSLRPDTFGQLFFWDHELEASEGDPATFSNLFFIDSSFNDFFSKLNKFDLSQVRLKPGQVKRIWRNPNFKPRF